MPRDLEQEEKPAPPVLLSESPNTVAESPDQQQESFPPVEYQKQFVIVPGDQQSKAPKNLHPYTRPLTISDLESVVALENAAFPNPSERATREKVRTELSLNQIYDLHWAT